MADAEFRSAGVAVASNGDSKIVANSASGSTGATPVLSGQPTSVPTVTIAALAGGSVVTNAEFRSVEAAVANAELRPMGLTAKFNSEASKVIASADPASTAGAPLPSGQPTLGPLMIPDTLADGSTDSSTAAAEAHRKPLETHTEKKATKKYKNGNKHIKGGKDKEKHKKHTQPKKGKRQRRLTVESSNKQDNQSLHEANNIMEVGVATALETTTTEEPDLPPAPCPESCICKPTEPAPVTSAGITRIEDGVVAATSTTTAAAKATTANVVIAQTTTNEAVAAAAAALAAARAAVTAAVGAQGPGPRPADVTTQGPGASAMSSANPDAATGDTSRKIVAYAVAQDDVRHYTVSAQGDKPSRGSTSGSSSAAVAVFALVTMTLAVTMRRRMRRASVRGSDSIIQNNDFDDDPLYGGD